MPADKLGLYVTSDAFIARANAAVEKAVKNLESKGIKPVYVTRQRQEPPHITKSAGEEQK